MKRYMIPCILIAVLFCGCRHRMPDAIEQPEGIVDSLFTEPSTTEPTTEPTETTEPVTETDIPTTPSISAEEAQILADNGMEYVHTNNALAIIQNTTYGEVTRTIPDDTMPDRSDEALAAWLEKMWKEGTHHNMNDCSPFFLYSLSREDSDFFDFTCQNPVPMTTIEVQNLNAILKLSVDYFSDAEDFSLSGYVFPEIIDGYSFEMEYKDRPAPEGMKMYVLKTTESDTYQFDLYYSPYAHSVMGFLALAQASEMETETSQNSDNQ